MAKKAKPSEKKKAKLNYDHLDKTRTINFVIGMRGTRREERDAY